MSTGLYHVVLCSYQKNRFLNLKQHLNTTKILLLNSGFHEYDYFHSGDGLIINNFDVSDMLLPIYG